MDRPHQFTVLDERHDEGIHVVRVSGDIDLSTCDSVEVACRRSLEHEGPDALIVDLASTGFLDSSGIAMLVRVHRRAADAGVPFALVAQTSRVVRSLEITGAATTLAIAQTLAEARDIVLGGRRIAPPGDAAAR